MNTTQLLQEITDFNSLSDGIFNLENDTRDINIWFSRVSSKWILEVDGKVIKDAKHLIVLVNKLQDMKLIGA
tara:strand:+ start:4543 stop:4758 length:216 start_codon:yes stop_codon:yes gene_type:complete